MTGRPTSRRGPSPALEHLRSRRRYWVTMLDFGRPTAADLGAAFGHTERWARGQLASAAAEPRPEQRPPSGVDGAQNRERLLTPHTHSDRGGVPPGSTSPAATARRPPNGPAKRLWQHLAGLLQSIRYRARP